MDFNIGGKIFSVDLVDRMPFYIDIPHYEANLLNIYQQMEPELRDQDYAPYPYYHPSKTDKVNNKFTSINGVLHQIKMYWDEVKFEEGLNNIITVIYINKDKKYNRRTLAVSEKERRKAYESR